jgi:hypothetical protein
LTDLPEENCIRANISQSCGIIPDDVNTPCHKRKKKSIPQPAALIGHIHIKNMELKFLGDDFAENYTIHYVTPLRGVSTHTHKHTHTHTHTYIYSNKLLCDNNIMILFKMKK